MDSSSVRITRMGRAAGPPSFCREKGGRGDATHWKGETAWGGRRDRPRSAWDGEGGKGATEGRGRLPVGEMRPQASHCSSGTYHTNPVHITL